MKRKYPGMPTKAVIVLHDTAFVPAATQGILCGRNPLDGATMGYLPQHPWVLFLIAYTFVPRTVSEWVSFELAYRYVFLFCNGN
jgi:hypothetical protein